jgi:hypothetical protein
MNNIDCPDGKMEGLGLDVLTLIASMLPSLRDVSSFGLVCRRFGQAVERDVLWRMKSERELGDVLNKKEDSATPKAKVS